MLHDNFEKGRKIRALALTQSVEMDKIDAFNLKGA